MPRNVRDVYLSNDFVVTTRDRLEEPEPIFPAPTLPSRSQALIRRESARRPARTYLAVPRSPRSTPALSTSAPAQLEERAPRRQPRYEVPPPPKVIQQQQSESRYEIPPPPLLPVYYPAERFVLPPPIDQPTVAQESYVPGPVPEVPTGRRHQVEPQRQASGPSQTLRVDIPQGNTPRHRRAASSTSSVSPSALSTPRSGRSSARRSEHSQGDTPDTSTSRESRGDKGRRLLESPGRGPRGWEEVVFQDSEGRKHRQYRYD